MIHAALILALAAAPQRFHSADGNDWRVTRTAGDSRSGYEQWYLHVERLAADGSTLEVIKFEETAWIEKDPVMKRSVRVVLSLDGKGRLQAEQRTSTQGEKGPPEVTVVLFRWDGKAFKPAPKD